MKPYSIDLRERIVSALDEGQSSPKVAVRFGVSESFVRKLRMRLRTHGHFEWLSPPGRARLLSDADENRLYLLALEHADATIAELRALAKKTLNLTISLTIVGRRLRERGLTRKKSPSGPPRWTVPTSKQNATASGDCARSAKPRASSSSMKQASTSR